MFRFALRLSEFSNLVKEIQKKKHKLNREIEIINGYMRKKNLAGSLRALIY